MTATSQRSHLDLEALLAPIPDGPPHGAWLRYEGTYDAIEEARREEDPAAPRDIWVRPLKVADWAEVEHLCVEALATKSKDFQIAAWLLEAWSRQRGLEGLHDGLQLLLGMTQTWWDDAFPNLDVEDPEWRAAPFHWLNEKFSERMSLLPVTPPAPGAPAAPTWGDVIRARAQGHDLPDGRSDGDEASAEATSRWSRDALKDFVESLPETDRYAFAQLLEDTIQLCARLELELDERMGAAAPGLTRVRQVLGDIRSWWAPFVPPPPSDGPAEEPADEPDPAAHLTPTAPAEGDGPLEENGTQTREASSRSSPPDPDQEVMTMSQGPITSREDAYRRLLEIADYLQATEPHSPTPYLIRRAASWGHMTLRELLFEFAQDGLDLRALFTFLGLDEDSYQQEGDHGQDDDIY